MWVEFESGELPTVVKFLQKVELYFLLVLAKLFQKVEKYFVLILTAT